LAAQAHNPPDFIKTEADRLRRAARKSKSYRASLPQAWPAVRLTTAFRSSREKRCLLACDSPFEYYRAVHNHCWHRTNTVRLAFLAHLLRRATPLNDFAAARRNRFFHQPQGVVAKRATCGENFDFLFPTIPLTSSLLAVSELHPFAATLAERFAREFAKEFSILLCFAAARLHLFAGETAH
jgi:hypothetical protein